MTHNKTELSNKKISRIKTYNDLKKNVNNVKGIPKIIFRTGKFNVSELPAEVVEIYECQLSDNEGYELFYFDDHDCQKFIEDYCSKEYLDAYNGLVPKAYKADFWRYAVLYHFGGIYLDFSMQTLLPLDEIVKISEEIYVRDITSYYGLYNAFIATKPKTKFLEQALSQIHQNYIQKKVGINALDVTGPTMLGNLFKKMLNVDEIELGYQKNGFYLYVNKDRHFIESENGVKIIKNKHENHYLWLYGQKVGNVNLDPYPYTHYSRLWSANNIFA